MDRHPPRQAALRVCYQAAQVLAENIQCTACGQAAGNPDTDAIVVLKVADWLGAHFTCASPARTRTCVTPGTTQADTARG